MLNTNNETYYMKIAIEEAKKAFNIGEIPVGAVIETKGKIIAKAYNQCETLNDVTAHAEMIAFSIASEYLGSKNLKDCNLYVTLEPCSMCAGASYWSKLNKITYGVACKKTGFTKISKSLTHPKTKIVGNILEKDCLNLLKKFFKSKR